MGAKKHMLKERRIKSQLKTIKRLQDDNIRLHAENRELKCRLQEQSRLIDAAEAYRKEHRKALSALSEAKERYNQAVREIVAEKQRYGKEFEACLKGMEGGILYD